MTAGKSLPSVEHSLDQFIAKANRTLVDVNTWNSAEQKAREEAENRKEQEALRWKQAEAQLRERDEREQSLRGQLDGLQSKLAEAEARAAVAMSAASSSSQSLAQAAENEATIGELKHQIDAMMQRVRASEEQSQRLSKDLSSAQQELRMSRVMPAVTVVDDAEAAERVRLAEAKAAKALAAARAAAAGLTVSSADLAAIESGLVVVDPPRRPSPVVPVVPIALAFVGGIAIMFAVWKFTGTDDKAPAAAAARPAPAQVQASSAPVAAPIKPIVTPIEEPAAAPELADTAQPAKPGPTVTPIEDPAPTARPHGAPEEPPARSRIEPKPAMKVTKSRPATRSTAKRSDKKPSGGIVDPF